MHLFRQIGKYPSFDQLGAFGVAVPKCTEMNEGMKYYRCNKVLIP